MTHKNAMRWFERKFIWKVLLENRGNQLLACKSLGLHRNTLNRKMQELGIDAQEARDAARLAERVTA